VNLTLSYQHLHQLEPEIRHAVLGTAGTLISFRVGPEDAAVLGKEFQPKFDVQDLLNHPDRSIYLKLMIAGAPSQPVRRGFTQTKPRRTTKPTGERTWLARSPEVPMSLGPVLTCTWQPKAKTLATMDRLARALAPLRLCE
jgi:hypothetical protein